MSQGRRLLIGFLAASLLPVLGALQLIKTADLEDAKYWLSIGTVGVSSTASAGIFVLTLLNAKAGNDPIPVTKKDETPIIGG